MKAKKTCFVLLMFVAISLLFQREGYSQQNQPEESLQRADSSLKSGDYSRAIEDYGRAFSALAEMLKDEEARPSLTGEGKILKKKNIADLRRKLREISILKRRAELKKMAVERDAEIAQKKIAAKREIEIYKEKRKQENLKREAEKVAGLEAKRRLEELKLARVGEIESEEEIAKDQKAAEAKDIKKKKEEKIEPEPAKEQKKKEAKKIKPAVKETPLPKKETPEERTEKAKTKEKPSLHLQKMKKAEWVQKRKQERGVRDEESRKADAVKKAVSCKTELAKYVMDTKTAESDIVKRAERLIEKADEYFRKEMYKEAAELYARSYSILKGKTYY